MIYYLFLDESGDHGLNKIDEQFPVFILCGVIIRDDHYTKIDNSIKKFKEQFFEKKRIILHSSDIRRKKKGFEILFDSSVQENFFRDLNLIMANSEYSLIAAAINKPRYIKEYGRLQDDVYEVSLSFIIERTIFMLDGIDDTDKQLRVIIEKRGNKEDNKLREHFQKIKARGTGYVDSKRILNYGTSIHFRSKSDDISGLQLSDLAAYPIARFILNEEKENVPFGILKSKFYEAKGKRYGLKIFP